MQTHWAFQYIGKPWVPAGRGPDVFDCYGLLVWCKKKHYNEDLPPYNDVDAASFRKVAVEMTKASVASQWPNIGRPVDGCAVGLSQSRVFHHCGIYLAVDGGLILHAAENSRIIAQSPEQLKALGWGRIEYFQYRPCLA